MRRVQNKRWSGVVESCGCWECRGDTGGTARGAGGCRPHEPTTTAAGGANRELTVPMAAW